jgi:tripartite-type tricarboxylate transporter receptor subunit TctC
MTADAAHNFGFTGSTNVDNRSGRSRHEGPWPLFRTALVAVSVACAAGTVVAQDFPSRPMTMVVSAAAGGPIDVFGRIMAERMSQLLGQRVVIENVAGAGGMLGGQRVAKADPDGYTMLLGTIATHAHSQTLYRKPLYDAVKDFTPVALVAELPLVLIARKDLPANTFEEFVAYAKANPGRMNFGSAGAGSATHLGCLVLAAAIGADFQHVPYRGTGPAMQDLQAGRIDFLCEIVVTAVPQIQAGAVKAIASLSAARAAVLPDVPTVVEKGLPTAQAYSWTAVFLPKGAPAAVVARLHDATAKTMDTPTVREQLQGLGAVIVGPGRRSPEYLQRFVQDEIEKWAEPIRASGAIVD